MMVGSNLKEGQLQQIVDKTILLMDKDQDGMINFQEFSDIVSEFIMWAKLGGGGGGGE